MQNIQQTAQKSASLLALNLYKQYLPQSVPKDLYDKEFQSHESYNYSEKHLDALQVYMKSLKEQTELLERYQIGVRRDEQSKNNKIAELCGLKIVKPNFEELDKKSLNFKNKFSYSTNYYQAQKQNQSLVHSHYSSGFQFTPNKYMSFPSILEQKQKTLQEKNSREFLGFLRQQERMLYNYDYMSDVEENCENFEQKQQKQSQSIASPMVWFILPILLGIKSFYYLINYLAYSEIPLPYQFYLDYKNRNKKSQKQQQQFY
ncbi:hypothetical protein PPERSA_04691 [Pseudocohnilembus persalinus]|uniref:Transmembrane protein n=1 Tax=Pseudocohnilembus persalinus TaxID=266149 RepID=A0A0V0R4H8_PSEPJ|nr:hypothetical protein PPERSA_04691 [Pseudocohnilembus persalinus]|eukprot:KRX09385.1 hypothetical protein PPERSA_04691 [Pseudocohnilembus persalinus]